MYIHGGGLVDRTTHEVIDFTVKSGFVLPLQKNYCNGTDLKNEELSPVYGDYKSFLPLFLTCDTNETLAVDARIIYQKCLENNVEVKFIEMNNIRNTIEEIINQELIYM